jgi:hypothetical protein
MRAARWIAVVCAGCCAAGGAAAQAAPADALFDAPARVDDERLDRLRGGMDLAGLHLSFGLQRSVYLNGTLVLQQQFALQDVSRISGDEARALAEALGGALVVRDGAAGRLPASMPPMGVLVQNSLDGQSIRQLSTLNVATDSLGLLKALNAAAALDDTLRRLPGP